MRISNNEKEDRRRRSPPTAAGNISILLTVRTLGVPSGSSQRDTLHFRIAFGAVQSFVVGHDSGENVEP